MSEYKYFKFLVNNDGDPTKIARAMRRLNINLASDENVSSIMYGLRFHHASGKAILEGCIHFVDYHDGYELAADMPDFALWGSTYHESNIIHQHLRFHPCTLFIKLGVRAWNHYWVGAIRMETTATNYNFEM